MKTLVISLMLMSQMVWSLPSRPTSPEHPASAQYEYDSKKTKFQAMGRTVDVFLPISKKGETKSFPVVVFGHGQAIDVSGYELTFQHLAQKGVAVLFPQFDTGFFDQEWRRMASDFNKLTAEALKKYPELDPQKLIYSGHSKGAYISLMAAGAPNLQNLGLNVASLVMFAPAGFDDEYLKNLPLKTPLTLIWSDQDTVIKKSLVQEIYSKAASQNKQFLQVTSYPDLPADHFFPLSKSFFFGGRNGLSPYHFFGSWKWLLGAAWDIESGQRLENPYLYGEECLSTGVPELKHQILNKSW